MSHRRVMLLDVQHLIQSQGSCYFCTWVIFIMHFSFSLSGQQQGKSAGGTNPEAASASSGDSSSTIGPADNFSDSDIQEIIQIGFTRTEAIDELRRQNGNKTQAIAALFAKSLKM